MTLASFHAFGAMPSFIDLLKSSVNVCLFVCQWQSNGTCIVFQNTWIYCIKIKNSLEFKSSRVYRPTVYNTSKTANTEVSIT